MQLRDLVEELKRALVSLRGLVSRDEAEDYATRHFRLHPHTTHQHTTHVATGTAPDGHSVSLYHHKPTNSYHIIKHGFEHGKPERVHKHVYSSGLAHDAQNTFKSMTKRRAA